MGSPAKWGSEFRVNTETEISQLKGDVVALPDGRSAVVWIDNSQFNDTTAYLSLRLQFLNADGSKDGPEILVEESFLSPLSFLFPRVTVLDDGRLGVSWVADTDDNAVAQLFDSDGSRLGGNITLNSSASTQIKNLEVVGLSDGSFVATWWSPDTGVRGQLFNADGSPSGGEFAVNTSFAGGIGDPTVIALSSGGFAVAWSGSDSAGTGVRVQIIDQFGQKVGNEFGANVVDLGTQENPSIAQLGDGRLAVTWTDTGNTHPGDNSASAISLQILELDGTPVGSTVLVNSTTASSQFAPRIAPLQGGGFAVAWLDNSITSNDFPFVAVRVQVFDSTGAKVGDELETTIWALDVHNTLSISTLADGRFVVTWDDASFSLGDTSFLATHGQIFDARTAAVVLPGTAADDQYVGTEFADTLNGQDGNDILIGGDGGDTVNGGAGADRLLGDGGNDELNGDGGNDNLVGSVGNDTLNGGVGDDTLRGNAGFDTLNGGSGNDTLSGDFNADILRGGDDDDTLNGGAGSDRLFGDAGNDIINGDDGNDSLVGSVGNDTLDGGAGNDTMRGNAGFDLLSGGSGNDQMFGDFNADNLFGGDGNDILNGGFGFDRLFGDDGDDTLNGDQGPDSLWGGLGNDTLNGGSDNDTLRGNAGFDTLNGGAGDDTLYGDFNRDTLNGGKGADQLFGGAGGDTVNDWEDGTDVLDFSGVTSVTTIADLTISAVSGTQTDISYDDGTGTVTLTVLSASPFSIDQSDVIL